MNTYFLCEPHAVFDILSLEYKWANNQFQRLYWL
jgi:hypothetical protein